MKYIYICHKCKHTYKYNVKWCIQTYWFESERRMIKCTGRCLERVEGETEVKNKEEGIPYNIIGNGIMVADAEDVRKHAKYQFDNCNEYFNKQRETQTANQHTVDILKEAIKLCEDYSNDRYNLYKGRSPYKGNEEGRADNYVEGQSAGAEYCVNILEEVLERLIKGD